VSIYSRRVISAGGRIVIAGGSGLIGTALCASYRDAGYPVTRLVRRTPEQPDDVTWDPGAPDPAKALDVGDLKDRIADSIAKLPEREKLVIALYYYENLTLREIGEVLGVTESRISQLHTKAVLRLRSRLTDENGDGELT